MRPETLPLFPLEVVLFPGIRLPLHIFEPRYKLMTRRCLEQGREFGVVLAQAGQGMAAIGCSAAILEVVKQYDDGRMDILTVGRSRFRLLEVFRDLPYLQGRADFLPDQDEATGPGSSVPLLKSYQEVFSLLYGRQPPSAEYPAESSLSFRIAAELPFDLDYKQTLLELLSEARRRESLAERLHAWFRQLKKRQRVKVKAGGNGHCG